jgi:LuxR family maltose regulon positive regulatory protein
MILSTKLHIPHAHREQLVLRTKLMQYGAVNEALLMLEKLYRLVDDEDRLRDKIRMSILQSIALHRQGDVPNALMKLQDALHMAEPQGYLRSFVDEGEKVADLLSQYLHQRQHGFFRDSVTLLVLSQC